MVSQSYLLLSPFGKTILSYRQAVYSCVQSIPACMRSGAITAALRVVTYALLWDSLVAQPRIESREG